MPEQDIRTEEQIQEEALLDDIPLEEEEHGDLHEMYEEEDDDIEPALGDVDADLEEEEAPQSEEEAPESEEEVEYELSNKEKVIEFLKKHGIYVIIAAGLAFVGLTNLFSGGGGAAHNNNMSAVGFQPNTSASVSKAPPTLEEKMAELDHKKDSTSIKPSRPHDESTSDQPSQTVIISDTHIQKMVDKRLEEVLGKDMEKIKGFASSSELKQFKGQVASVVSHITQKVDSNALKIQSGVSKSGLESLNAKLQKQNDILAEQLHKQSETIKKLNDRIKSIESMPIVSSTSGHQSVAPHKSSVKYKLASAIKDRAWIVGHGGELIPLNIGDQLKGYGEILDIKANGTITTVSGMVQFEK